MLRDSQIDLCGQVDFTRTQPLLGRDEAFSFACNGCGNCCRGREDIIHDAEPLVCALYPLAQEISGEGAVSYFLQPTSCGGPMFSAKVEDYLARYDVPAREAVDVCWAQTCMTLEDTVEELNTILSPVLARRLEAKLWQALYYDYEFAQPFLPQLERNLRWLEGECAKLRGYQEQLSAKRIEKNDR